MDFSLGNADLYALEEQAGNFDVSIDDVSFVRGKRGKRHELLSNKPIFDIFIFLFGTTTTTSSATSFGCDDGVGVEIESEVSCEVCNDCDD